MIPALLLTAGLLCQDVVLPLSTKKTSYETAAFPISEPIRLAGLDGKPVTLSFDKWTLIHIWSTCCGADIASWGESRALEDQYTKQGMRVLSINFENGTLLPEQTRRVTEFLAKNEIPRELYMDNLGYCSDVLKVRGFPSYVLVSPENQVVFYTNGNDPEGMSLLAEKIQSSVPAR